MLINQSIQVLVQHALNEVAVLQSAFKSSELRIESLTWLRLHRTGILITRAMIDMSDNDGVTSQVINNSGSYLRICYAETSSVCGIQSDSETTGADF